MSDAIALEASKLSKSFLIAREGEFWRVVFGRGKGLVRVSAIENVDLRVPKGEFVGVIGRNGAGKSTLLRTLGGAYEPTAGQVRSVGDISSLYELGTVSNPEMTGREYAERYLALTGCRRNAETVIEDIRKFSELESRFEDALRSYSAGMKARLFFSCATAEEHDLYLIDEVLSVGDLHFQSKCWKRIRERLSGGASGVLVTHDWSSVLKLCRSACLLDSGRISAAGDAAAVVRSYLKSADTRTKREGVARFLDLPSKLTWRTGETATIRFEIELNEPRRLAVVFAIEKLLLGFGWEVMLLETIDVGTDVGPGRLSATLSIPDLPLRAGTYTLAMNLVEVDPANPLDRLVFDGVGWQDGDPLEIEVQEEPLRLNQKGASASLNLKGQWVTSSE